MSIANSGYRPMPEQTTLSRSMLRRADGSAVRVLVVGA